MRCAYAHVGLMTEAEGAAVIDFGEVPGQCLGEVADWVSSDTHRIQVQVLRFVDQLP